MLTAIAAEIVDTDQPNSARSGSISTPGTARNAAAPTSARKVTAATPQAGWMRWTRGGAARVTRHSMTDPIGRERRPERPKWAGIRPPARPTPSPDVTGDSSQKRTDGGAVWLSTTYRRRPRSSGAAGIDVGLRLRHRGAPGCLMSR